jgi:hypothetical protein
VEEALVVVLDMFVKKGLQLININPKQCGGQGTTLFNPDGTPDEISYPVNCVETTRTDSYRRMMAMSRVREMPLSLSI